MSQSTTEDPLDVLRLRERVSGPELKFGSVDVSFASARGSAQTALNARSTAQVDLLPALLAGEPVDYLAPMRFGYRRGGGHSRTYFTGSVLDAEPEGARIHVSAETAPELTERELTFLEIKQAVVPEIIHLMARTAGFPEHRLNIEGLEDLPLEAIEVITPLQGVSVDSPLTAGTTRIVPPAVVHETVAEFSGEDAIARFRDADTYAIGFRIARRLLDAETAVLNEVDEVLSWLTVRARYGLALLPDGQPQRYRRVIARARPRRGDLVLVRAMISGRRWLRAPEDREAPVILDLDTGDPSWGLPSNTPLSLESRQALLACARGAHALDPLERIQALFDAVEFYVSRVAVGKRFSPAEAKRVRRSVPTDVDPELRKRAVDLLGKLNDPPLFAKLSEAARRDGVPLADGEVELLRTLRQARNDAVHGRLPSIPEREDIDHAVSIVARLLLFRLSAGAARPTPQVGPDDGSR